MTKTEFKRQLKDLLKRGQKLQAVKLVKEFGFLGLKRAKELVDYQSPNVIADVVISSRNNYFRAIENHELANNRLFLTSDAGEYTELRIGDCSTGCIISLTDTRGVNIQMSMTKTSLRKLRTKITDILNQPITKTHVKG